MQNFMIITKPEQTLPPIFKLPLSSSTPLMQPPFFFSFHNSTCSLCLLGCYCFLETPPRPPVFLMKTCTNTSSDDRSNPGIGLESTTIRDENVFLKMLRSDRVCMNNARAVLGEMVGTFYLMYFVCGIIASTQLTPNEPVLLEYAIIASLTIIVLIFAFGPISGAHVNPAITIAFATFGHFPWPKVPLYIFAQTLGSILATYVGGAIYGLKAELMTTRPLQGCSSAFWAEFIATAMIVFLAASLTYQNQFVGPLSGIVIGLAIGLAVLVTGPISGGSLNPARSLGPAIVARSFNGIWIYMTAPVVGAMFGALLYHILRHRGQVCNSTASPTSEPMFTHSSLSFGGSQV